MWTQQDGHTLGRCGHRSHIRCDLIAGAPKSPQSFYSFLSLQSLIWAPSSCLGFLKGGGFRLYVIQLVLLWQVTVWHNHVTPFPSCNWQHLKHHSSGSMSKHPHWVLGWPASEFQGQMKWGEFPGAGGAGKVLFQLLDAFTCFHCSNIRISSPVPVLT